VDFIVFEMIHPALSIPNHLEIGNAVADEAGHGFPDIVLQSAGSIEQRETMVFVIYVS